MPRDTTKRMYTRMGGGGGGGGGGTREMTISAVIKKWVTLGPVLQNL